MSRRRSPVIVLSVVTLVGGCVPAPTGTPPGAASLPAPTLTPPGSSRLGTFDLRSPSGAPIGTIALTEGGAETVTINVALADPGIHPWGIFDQPTCAMPTPNHDAPFQFADVEDGHHSESISTVSYLSFPGPLVAVVFDVGGGAVDGCAALGLPQSTAQATPSPGACATVAPGARGPDQPELAISRDALSDAEIFVIHDDGADPRRLTDSLGPDIKPSWSPDGRQLAFRTSRDGQDEIYVMNADGTCQRNLTHSSADDRSPAWSPNGTSIAFDHFFTDAFQDVAVIDVAGLHVRRVTTLSGEYPAWSPDGSRIAFASARDGDYEIYVINADGTGERQLTHNGSYDMYPAWSPDGQWLAYEHGSDPFRDIDIHVMRADGADDRAVTAGDATNRFPAWSPDGRLAWTRSGLVVIAAALDATPIEIGAGQFPAWRP